MNTRSLFSPYLTFVALCLLGGCSLLGGGKPDALYRFGTVEPTATTAMPSSVQQTLLLQKISFAPEIEGDRLLAVHGGSALHIKGMRWVTAAPSLFTNAMLRTIQLRTPDIRVTTQQSGDANGYVLALSINRFEAQYAYANMLNPPMITIEGDAMLYSHASRKLASEKYFTVQIAADKNRADDIVTAFDRATARITRDMADWLAAATVSRIQ